MKLLLDTHAFYRTLSRLKNFSLNAPNSVVYFGIVLAVLMLGTAPTRAEAAKTSDSGTSEPASFVRDIAPILNKKCIACHGPDKSKGHYRVDTFESIMKQGSSELPPVTPGNTAASHLFELITDADPDDRMPQKDDPLSDAQISLVKRWIEQGARRPFRWAKSKGCAGHADSSATTSESAPSLPVSGSDSRARLQSGRPRIGDRWLSRDHSVESHRWRADPAN
jgi:hypothetical protein